MGRKNVNLNAGDLKALPIKGRAGAVIHHLSVTLHLQVGVTVVTAVVFKLVYRLQGGSGERGGALTTSKSPQEGGRLE